MKRILLILLFALVGSIGYSQGKDADTVSHYTKGKINSVEQVLPGAGKLKGTVYILNTKITIPLAFIDVRKGKQVQADAKGNFELELDTDTYTIKVSIAGYEDLVIKDFTIKWGKEHNISVYLATSKGFEKK